MLRVYPPAGTPKRGSVEQGDVPLPRVASEELL